MLPSAGRRGVPMSVPEDYIAVAVMALVGIGFPVGSFIASRLLRPTPNPNDKTQLRSWLLPGYETDQTLYVRRHSTYECGSEPVGDAHINFHFQYYWYAIIFLVFDVAFMFMVAWRHGGIQRRDTFVRFRSLQRFIHTCYFHDVNEPWCLACFQEKRQNLHLREYNVRRWSKLYNV